LTRFTHPVNRHFDEEHSMMPTGQQRKIAILCLLIFFAFVYMGLLSWMKTLTGNPLLDGVVGVVAGLYICSQPAANAVDLLFFQRFSIQQLTSGWSGLRWLALNLLTFLMGWLMITTGAMRLAAR
jgi:hypothetical protein